MYTNNAKGNISKYVYLQPTLIIWKEHFTNTHMDMFLRIEVSDLPDVIEIYIRIYLWHDTMKDLLASNLEIACHWDLLFYATFIGMKWMCRTTGHWWCCLSAEVVSSIPAGSTIIVWFLCGFIFVSLCQSIKIKPAKMIYMRVPQKFSPC